jgi:hypothetical protein
MLSKSSGKPVSEVIDLMNRSGNGDLKAYEEICKITNPNYEE